MKPSPKALALGLATLLAVTLTVGHAWQRRRQKQDLPLATQAHKPARLWRRLRRACRQDRSDDADITLSAWLQALPPDEATRWRQDAALSLARSQLLRARFGAPSGGPAVWRGEALWLALNALECSRQDRSPTRTWQLPTLHP